MNDEPSLENSTELPVVFVDIAGTRKGVKLDPTEVYTTDQLAIELGVPEYAIRERVRDGKLQGEKIGQFFFVSGKKFIEFLEGGFTFTPRPGSRTRSLQEDVQRSIDREARRTARMPKS